MTDPSRHGVLRVVLAGDLDFASNAETAAKLAAALESGVDVEVDLSDVRFMDSDAIGVLLRARRLAVDRGRRLQITQMSESVRYVFALMGLTELMTGR
ncbi:STAS domain-containing protein [Hamadaea sp. NPDC050747]|uniref:STAS domain-containing protein n=1 Tax=Hamadaea sp. NPDC050747 TaxID=3155789 RepID=UPI0033E7E0ED